MAEDALEDGAHRCLLEFLERFRLPGGGAGEAHYVAEVRRLVRCGDRTLWVSFKHFDEAESTSLSFEPSDLRKLIASKYTLVKDALDAAVTALVARLDREGPIDEGPAGNRAIEYAVAFYAAPSASGTLGSDMLGRLMAFTGRVMQASEALPELLFGSFRCEACGAERRGLRQDFAGGLPSRCPRRACGSRTHWRLQDEGPATQWGDWRRLRLQLPTGGCFAAASPRCVTAFVRTERGGCCDPGTHVAVSGCLTALPLPSSRSGSPQAAHEFAILGNLVPVKPEQAADVHRPGQLAARRPSMSAPGGLPAPEDRGRLLDKLASAIAPAVVGHLEAKKGLVLMLLGGVCKKNGDGGQLRGNIHLCLLGSAGTAKSSLLKWVAELVPQSVYTSGLSSSAPGLTASLSRDPGSGAPALLPGALMQAGNGICCIDDFDLLEQGGRQAVHDAMDREEINLAKAGLHARLNVGASVLAACSTRCPASGLAAQRPSEARIAASVASRFDLVLPLDALALGSWRA